MIRVALDAMGGDGAPDAPVRGALEALEERPEELEVLLVGDPAPVEDRLRALGGPRPGMRIVPARETVGMDEPPVAAVRRKRESSIVVGVELQRDGEADAFVSAGSTGAVMAASVLVLGSLTGVDRPAVGAVVPTASTPTLVLDVGANVSCKPRHLHQFAHLGSIYMSDLLRAESPRVGLLNVGEEDEKGDDLAVATFGRLADDPDLHFVGNVEGHRIIEGACDVLVCDGFVGNVVLKFYESIAGYVVGLLEQATGEEDRPELERIRTVLDYAEYGGAPLLGIGGVSIVCHGASPPRAIRNAVGVAVRSVESDIVEHMSRDLEALARRVG